MKRTHLPYDGKLTAYAKTNRKTSNEPEKKLWREALALKKLEGYKFTRQKPVESFILDFYCSSLLLGIEVDGDSHVKQTEYDHERTTRLTALGIRIIRYTNRDVMRNFRGVCYDLIKQVRIRETELGKTTPLNPPLSGGHEIGPSASSGPPSPARGEGKAPR